MARAQASRIVRWPELEVAVTSHASTKSSDWLAVEVSDVCTTISKGEVLRLKVSGRVCLPRVEVSGSCQSFSNISSQIQCDAEACTASILVWPLTGGKRCSTPLLQLYDSYSSPPFLACQIFSQAGRRYPPQSPASSDVCQDHHALDLILELAGMHG